MNLNSRLTNNLNRALVLSLLTITFGFQARASGQENNSPHVRTASVLEKFQTETTSADYFEVRFEDLLAQLSKSTSTNFVIDESAKDNQLDEETVIILKLNDVRIATLLDETLYPFDCTWLVKDGIVRIVSTDAALDLLQIRTFDCTDLLAKTKPIETVRIYRPIKKKVAPVVGNRSSAGQLGGGRFSVQEEQKTKVASPTAKPKVAEPQVATEPQAYTETEVISPTVQLHDLIQNTIDPDSWEGNGGNGRLQFINGIVVISQTNSNLRAIDDFLDSLRESGLMK